MLHILWKPNVHQHVHNSLPLVLFLGLFNLVHSLSSCFLKIHFNTIIQSMPIYVFKKPPSTGFPTKPCIYFSSPQTCHVPCPSHASNHTQCCPFCLRHVGNTLLSCLPDTQTLAVSEANRHKRSGDTKLHPIICHEDTEGC